MYGSRAISCSLSLLSGQYCLHYFFIYLFLFTVIFAAAYNSFCIIIFHQYAFFFIVIVFHFFHLDQSAFFIHSLTFSHKTKVISSTANSFLRHIIIVITEFWLKSRIYFEKVPVMTNNTLTWPIIYISIIAFWGINFIIPQHL